MFVFDTASQLSFLQSDFIYPPTCPFYCILAAFCLFNLHLVVYRLSSLSLLLLLLCGDEACQRRLVAAWPEKSAALTFGIYMDGLNEP